MESIGIANTSSTSSPAIAEIHGWCCTTRLHRYQTLRFAVVSAVALRRTEKRSIERPTKPRSAGTSVIDASMTTATVTDAPMARPITKSTPMMNRPSREMTTVVPANSTARPAVSMERTVAACGSIPSPRLWR